MSIAGIFKEVTTITVSAWVFGDELTPLNILGVGITFIGATTAYLSPRVADREADIHTQVSSSTHTTNTRKRSIRPYRSMHMETHCHKKRQRRFYRVRCGLISLRRASLTVMWSSM